MQPFVDQHEPLQGRAPTTPSPDPDDEGPTQRLVTLLDRIEEFAAQQFRRLEMMIGRLGDACGKDASLQGTQVEKWKPMREEEASADRQRIREEGQLLIRAWKELEDEQRRLLGARESLAVHRDTPCDAVIGEPRSAEELHVVEEMAFSQFQKLRREMQQHARRGNSA
jgi:hypothetical protein